MGEISKNNHYVPQFYLENWGAKNKIWKYQLLVSNENVPLWNEVSIKHTASHEQLYVRVKDNQEYDDLERMFDSKFETTAKESIDKVINEDRLTSEDWDKIIDFIGAQIVRTPAFYQRIREVVQNALGEGLENALDKLSKMESIPNNTGNVNEYDELIPIKCTKLEETDDEKYTNIYVETIEGKSTWLWAIYHLLDKPLKILHEHKWSIITCEEEMPTTDDPVICLNYYSQDNFNYNGGWKQKGTEIICPISPYKILYTQVGIKHPPRITYDKEQSKLLKEIIVKHAFREIYSSKKDIDICQKCKRVVSEEKFKAEKQMEKEWYEIYKDTEGKML